MSSQTLRWPSVLAALIAIGFAVGVLAMDVFFGVVVTRQIVAGQTWKSTGGTVVSSTVTGSRRVSTNSTTPNRPRNTTAKSRYRVSVSYTYVVDGKEYVGSRVSIAGFGEPSFRQESEAAALFPQGVAVPVFYNPADPAQSALRVGLQPEMAIAGFIILTFNAALFYGISIAARWWQVRRDPIRAYLRHDYGNRAVLRLTRFSALDLGVVVLFVGSFVSVFVVAFAVPVGLMGRAAIGLFVGLVLISGGACAWRSLRLAAGRCDIVVDRAVGRLGLPWRVGEREPTELRLADVGRIEVAVDDDRLKNNRVTRRLVVHAKGLDEPREVARWLNAREASLLAGWLRREIRLSEEVDPEDE